MPSNLRLQLDIESTQSYFPRKTTPSPPPQKSKMSLTQTYRVASSARGKLGMEASRPDHNLRMLVGHANLLDSLMLELANAEREQEAWFNNTVRSAKKSEEPARHIQWFDSIVEEAEYDEADSDSDSSSSSSDDEDEDLEIQNFTIPPRRRSVSPPPPAREFADEDEELEEDFDETVEELALERVPSRTPDLVHEHSDSDSSDDESMPPSPPMPVMHFTPDAKSATTVIDFALLANKNHLSAMPATPMISAY